MLTPSTPVELGGTPPATTGHSEHAPVSTRRGQGGQVRSFYSNLVVVMTKILGKFVLPRSRPGGWGGKAEAFCQFEGQIWGQFDGRNKCTDDRNVSRHGNVNTRIILRLALNT